MGFQIEMLSKNLRVKHHLQINRNANKINIITRAFLHAVELIIVLHWLLRDAKMFEVYIMTVLNL